MAMPNAATDLCFRSKDGAFGVRLGATARDQMLGLCVRAGRLETGGVLIGRYTADRRMAEIELATGPGTDSRAGRSWLIRGVEGLQRLLDQWWSGGRGYYLGEWHFHPHAAPTPSGRDTRQMRSIAASPEYHCPEPVLLIIGGDPAGDFALHVEVHTRTGDRVRLGPTDSPPLPHRRRSSVSE